MGTEITIKEAAKQLNISEQRIRTLCRNNELSARKIGSSWLTIIWIKNFSQSGGGSSSLLCQQKATCCP